MPVKITTLMENRPGEHHGLITEHGISYLVEKDGHSLIFDTGQSGAVVENGIQMNVDFTSVKYIVISHGHYDHSGGLRALLNMCPTFELLLGEGFFDEKYGFSETDCEYLGNSFDRKFLDKQKVNYRFAEKPKMEIVSNIYTVSGFPRIHMDEKINPRFKILKDNKFISDPFEDELSLVIDTSEGLVVLLGCSHPGLKNMLDHIVKLFDRPLYALLGGTHLVESSPESLKMSLDYLDNSSLKKIGASHCTGQEVIQQLATSSSRFFNNCTGSSLVIG